MGLAGGKRALGLRKGDEHGVHEMPQRPVGESGKGVLLLDRGGLAHQPGDEEHRPARVAADADHDVRIEPPQDPHRLPEGAREAKEAHEEADQADPLERTDVDDLQRISRLRDLARFDATRRSDKKHVVARVAGLHLFAQRQAGEEMATGASARDQEPHRCAPAARRRKPPGPPLTEGRMPAARQEAITDDVP